jgi:hypothetical protein
MSDETVGHYTRDLRDPEVRMLRMEHLLKDPQFGHDGSHIGNGTPGCPRTRHHHHDIYCAMPSDSELQLAGLKRSQIRSRAS